MASKVYTAQELRQTAQGIFVRGVVATVPSTAQYGSREKEVYVAQLKEMLLQAADALERNEKSNKKYEYAAKYLSVDDKTDVISKTHYESSEQATETAVKAHGIRHIVLRREVGEWEAVKQ